MIHARRTQHIGPLGRRMGRLASVLVAVCVIASLGMAVRAGADATMFRGGSGLAGVYPDKIKVPLALEWKFTAALAPSNPSSPAIVGNDVFYVAGSRIYCLNAESGAMKWRYPQDAPLSTVIYSSPAVADGLVYFGAGDGKLYALQASNGTYSWAFDTKNGIATSPTIADGIIYFGSIDGRIWAVDSKTHDTVPTWKGGVKTSDEITGAPAVLNGMVYALSLDQQLHAISTAAGKERLLHRVPASVLRMAPVAVGDYVFIANGGNMTCLMSRSLMQKWFLPMPSDIAVSPTANDQNVFLCTADGFVYSLDVRTGRTKWKSAKKLDYNVSAPLTLAGNTLLLGTSEGAIVAMDSDSGSVLWTYKVQPSTNNTETIVSSASIDAAPVVANGTVYIVTDDGSLNAFREDTIDTTPPIISDMDPEAGLVVRGDPPFHFEAKIVDEGSGVNPDSIKISLDSEGAPRRPEGEAGLDKSGFRFDLRDDMLEYDVLAPVGASAVHPLANGRHTVTVSAADWRGNVATKSWTFTVDNSVARTLKSRRDLRNARRNTNTGGGGGFNSGGKPGRGGSSSGGGSARGAGG